MGSSLDSGPYRVAGLCQETSYYWSRLECQRFVFHYFLEVVLFFLSPHIEFYSMTLLFLRPSVTRVTIVKLYIPPPRSVF